MKLTITSILFGLGAAFCIAGVLYLHILRKVYEEIESPFIGGSGKVPNNLWFTFKHDILATGQPKFYHTNIIKTIDAYRSAWDDQSAPARVLNNIECKKILKEVSIKLMHAFEMEKNGAYKGDICRLGALYLYGGYYFDVDMEVVTPIVLDEDVGFATAIDVEGKYYFNSFFAAAPGHPILKNYLDVLIQYYYDVENSYCQQIEEERVAGPCMLWNAYNITAESQRGHTVFLQETHAEDNKNCGYDVVDPVAKLVHFHSRIKGSFNCPYVPKKLWFTYEHDILKRKRPRYYYNNIQHIIELYEKEWGYKPESRVLSTYRCGIYLENLNPFLRRIFEHEKNSVNKVDLCRLAALYQHGGYFFHLDVEVVSPLTVHHDATFAGVKKGEFFSDSFIAAAPGHPIFDYYANDAMNFFSGDKDSSICHTLSDTQISGGCLLMESYNKLKLEEQRKMELYYVKDDTQEDLDHDIVESKTGEVLLKHFDRGTSWFHIF